MRQSEEEPGCQAPAPALAACHHHPGMRVLQYEQFGHVILDILHGLTYENTGHKATTYR